MENSIHTPEDLKTESLYPRLTVKEIKNEILSYMCLEKGLLFTLVFMLKKPAKTVSLYLHEDRRKIQNPFRYLIIAVAFSTFVMMANPSFRKYIATAQESSKASYAQMEKITGIALYEKFNQAQEIYMSYQNVVLTLALPLIALVTFLFYRKREFNYAEHMAIGCLVFGTIYWISGLYSLMTFFTDSVYIMYGSWFISIALGMYLYKKIFKLKIFKASLTIISAYLAALFVGLFFQFTVFAVLLMI